MEDKIEIIKDRSNVLSDQIKKTSSKINHENLNYFSLFNKNKSHKDCKLINDINKPKNPLLEYNYKLSDTEVKLKSNILNANNKSKNNHIVISTNHNSINHNINSNKIHLDLDHLNRKSEEKKHKYETDLNSNNHKTKNNANIVNYSNKILDNKNYKDGDISCNQINVLDTYSSSENSKLTEYNMNNNLKENSSIKRNVFNFNESIGKLGLRKINSIIKNTKTNNTSYDYIKNKVLTDIQSKYTNYITNDNTTVTKNTKFIEEIFTNLNYKIPDNKNEFENAKIKTVSLNKKLNSSIKSLTNDSINSNHDLLLLVQPSNPNTNKLNNNSKKIDSLIEYHNEGEIISDTGFKIDLNSSSTIQKIHNLKADSSFSSNYKNTHNNKILHLSHNTEVNPLDTDINIIENNRDKDREKDKLIINEIYNEEIKESIMPSNSFSADNYLTKMSDRTHDKIFNNRTYLEKIGLKNIGINKIINNNTKMIKETPKDLQYTSIFLNNLNNSKNNIPIVINNFKNNLEKSAKGKNKQIDYKEYNSNILFNNKIPYIQVKKYINKYLNEKNANKPLLTNKKDSDSLNNLELLSAKVIKTDPNENTEKTKLNLMKNFNIDIAKNNKIDVNFNTKKNSLIQKEYLYTEDRSSVSHQQQFNDTNTKKTILSDNQLYEFDENYDINNLSSERFPHCKNTFSPNKNLERSGASYSNHLDRGLFIKEKKNSENIISNLQAKVRGKESFSPEPFFTKTNENFNEHANSVLYLSVIEFINRNFMPFEIREIIEKIRNNSIFYLGEMNAKFQIFYSKLDLIKKFIEVALQRKELSINTNILQNNTEREKQRSDSYRSHNTGSSDTRNSGNTKFNNKYNLDKIIDDENGNYIVKIGDHIDYRYEILSELGQGSFGQALKCYDHKNKEFVCVKIIKNQKKFIKQSKIEISLLEYIQENDAEDKKNIVRILNNFPFRNHNVNKNRYNIN